MFLFGGLNALAMILCFLFIPNSLNKEVSDEEMAEFEAELEDLMAFDDDVNQSSGRTITLWTLMTNKHSFFAMMTSFVGTFNIAFWTGFISTTLVDEGLSDSEVGYVFALMSFAYLVSCLLIPCTCETSPRKF